MRTHDVAWQLVWNLIWHVPCQMGFPTDPDQLFDKIQFSFFISLNFLLYPEEVVVWWYANLVQVTICFLTKNSWANMNKHVCY